MNLWWLVAPGGVLALGMTVLNSLTWPRGGAGARLSERVSVLIPARNEARAVEACVRAAAALDPLEIVVCDDNSTDATPQILARLREELPALRVIQGQPLPPGWVGKPFACHQLAQSARGDWLLFLDADVEVAPDALGRLGELARRSRSTVLSAVPRQRTGTWVEALAMPLLHLTYTAWFPLRLVRASGNPAFLAANGQVMAVERAAYERLGGFAAVRGEVVDDMAFCRRAKVLGEGVVFADGDRLARCRMYTDGAALWRGFSKNLYAGLGARPEALLGVMALYFLSFVAPYVALGAGGAALAPGLVGVGANLTLRALLALRHGHRLGSVLLHPVAVLGLLALALNSWRWHRQGRIQWAGRVYSPGELQGAPGGV